MCSQKIAKFKSRVKHYHETLLLAIVQNCATLVQMNIDISYLNEVFGQHIIMTSTKVWCSLLWILFLSSITSFRASSTYFLTFDLYLGVLFCYSSVLWNKKTMALGDQTVVNFWNLGHLANHCFRLMIFSDFCVAFFLPVVCDYAFFCWRIWRNKGQTTECFCHERAFWGEILTDSHWILNDSWVGKHFGDISHWLH